MNTNPIHDPLQCPESVLVTGASARIGLELAKECLDLGYHAIIHYRTTVEPAKTALGDDGRVTYIQGELAESPERLVDAISKLPFKLVGLVNNASVFEPGDMSDPDHFQSVLAVNTLAPLRLSSAFARVVESGWIINITDARSRPLGRKYQNYRVSKLFLDEITRQLAYLYAPSIRVNAVAPGATLASGSYPKEEFNNLAATIPLGKTGDPLFVRRALRFLVENDYITGSVIPVDGGWHL